MDKTVLAIILSVAVLVAVVAARAGQAASPDAAGKLAPGPSSPFTFRPPPGTRIYVIQKGDTLFSIARRFDTTVDVIRTLNGLDDPDRIAVGQPLVVPDAAPSGRDPSVAAAASPAPAARPAFGFGRLYRYSQQDRRLLAAIIWLEARGEPFEGKVAVGAVVLNRVESPLFPDSVEEVLLQPGQFPFSAETLYSVQPDSSAWQAADRALAGEDPTGGALYFYNPERTVTPEFWAGRPVVARIGRHVFTR
ncbi:MAG: cell wall hydrolase [Limnochordaceae bacterium]|uniref:Cell wall hydrolase n=1 Tax=Carboxydichorda subterranea TaxID=3109565 RepID=A0ABZ1C0P4_9FIRM|nr:cell wall hydrolase [Limnochorda sp. L945t]MBE3598130.1 cell wall hydrolase [Limnochordaceae bacterium]WRP18346.1 cell wall hydrolase [Limnochorda sp. L945t]